MITKKTTTGNDKIFILLAPGFEEGPIIYYLAHLREAGLPVSLVSLSTGLVRGQHGLMVRPDQSLTQITPAQARMVLIPGGRQSLAALAADPRVHQLLQSTLCNKGYIVAAMKRQCLSTTKEFAPFMENGNFLSQEEQDIDSFAKQLINFGQVYS